MIGPLKSEDCQIFAQKLKLRCPDKTLSIISSSDVCQPVFKKKKKKKHENKNLNSNQLFRLSPQAPTGGGIHKQKPEGSCV